MVNDLHGCVSVWVTDSNGRSVWMEFENAPRFIEGLNMSTSELMLVALLVPLMIGLIVGIERELALFAAFAGVIAVLVAGF